MALEGTAAEAIFRVPGKAGAVAESRLRVNMDFYILDGIDDLRMPTSLLQLWLRKLQDPLFPAELYNSAVAAVRNSQRAIALLPSCLSPTSE